MYFFQRYFGDEMVKVNRQLATRTSSLTPSSFSSGQAGIVLVNKGITEQAVGFDINGFGYGDRYYYHTLTGSNDNGDFFIESKREWSPPDVRCGRADQLRDRSKQKETMVGNGIKLTVPARSVTYILVENGTNIITGIEKGKNTSSTEFIPTRRSLDSP